MALPRTAAAPHQSTVYAAMPAEPDEDYGYQAPATTIRPGGIDPAAFTRPDLANSSIAGRPKEWDAYRRGQATQARQDERQQARIATAEQRAQDRAEAAQAKQDEKAALQRSYLDVLGKGQEPDLDPTSGVYQPKLNPATGTPQQRRYTTGDRPDPTGAGTYEVRENDAGQMVVDRKQVPQVEESKLEGDFAVYRGKEKIDPAQGIFMPDTDVRSKSANVLRKKRQAELTAEKEDIGLALDDPKFASVTPEKVKEEQAKSEAFRDQSIIKAWEEKQALIAKRQEATKEGYRIHRMKPEEWEQEARKLHADKQDAAVMAHGATEAERLKKAAADIDAQTEALNARQAKWEQEQALGVPSHGFEAHARELADIADTRRAIEAQQAEHSAKADATAKWQKQEAEDSLHRQARGMAEKAAVQDTFGGTDEAAQGRSKPLLPGANLTASDTPEPTKPAPAEQDIRTLIGQTLREPVGAVMLNPKDSDYGQVVDKPENVPALMAHPQWDGRDLYLRRVDEGYKRLRPEYSQRVQALRDTRAGLAEKLNEFLANGETGFLARSDAPPEMTAEAQKKGTEQFFEEHKDDFAEMGKEFSRLQWYAREGLVPIDKLILAYREAGKDSRMAPEIETVVDAAGKGRTQTVEAQQARMAAIQKYKEEWSDTPMYDEQKVAELEGKQGEQLLREKTRRDQGWWAEAYRSGVKAGTDMFGSLYQGNRALWNVITDDKADMKQILEQVDSYNAGKRSKQWITMGEVKDQFRKFGDESWSDRMHFAVELGAQMVPQMLMTAGGGAIAAATAKQIVANVGTKAASRIAFLGLEGAAQNLISQGASRKVAIEAVKSGLWREAQEGTAGYVSKLVYGEALKRAEQLGMKSGLFATSLAQNGGELLGNVLSSFKPEDVDKNFDQIGKALWAAALIAPSAAALDMLDGNEEKIAHQFLKQAPKEYRKGVLAKAARIGMELGSTSMKEGATGFGQGLLGLVSQRITDGTSLDAPVSRAELEDLIIGTIGEAVGGAQTTAAINTVNGARRMIKNHAASRDLRAQERRVENARKAMGDAAAVPQSQAVRAGEESLAELGRAYEEAVKRGDSEGALNIRNAQVFATRDIADAMEAHAKNVQAVQTEAAGSPLAQAVLRVAAGEQVENMTDAEIGALGYERAPDGGVKPIKGVAPAVTKAPGGTWVVTDAAREATEGVAPSAKGLIRPEREVRQRDAAKANEPAKRPTEEAERGNNPGDASGNVSAPTPAAGQPAVAGEAEISGAGKAAAPVSPGVASPVVPATGKARDFGVKVRGEPEPRIIRAKSEKEAGDKVRGKLKKGQVIEKVEALPDDAEDTNNQEAGRGASIAEALKSFGEGALAATADRVKAGKDVTIRNPDAIQKLRASPVHTFAENPDGSLTITGVLDPRSKQWVGKAPAAGVDSSTGSGVSSTNAGTQQKGSSGNPVSPSQQTGGGKPSQLGTESKAGASESLKRLAERPSAEIIAELQNLGTYQERVQWLADNGFIEPVVFADGKKRPMVDYMDRKVILMRIGGIAIPFYQSTGLAGKKNVKSMRWYPVFGIESQSGWINKGTEAQINSYYDFPILAKLAKILDEGVGPVPISESPYGYLTDDGDVLDGFNAQMGIAGLKPAKNSDRAGFSANVTRVLEAINAEMEKAHGITSSASPQTAPATQNQGAEGDTGAKGKAAENKAIMDRAGEGAANLGFLADSLARPALTAATAIPGMLAARLNAETLGGRAELVFESRKAAEAFMATLPKDGSLTHGVNDVGALSVVNVRDVTGGYAKTLAALKMKPAPSQTAAPTTPAKQNPAPKPGPRNVDSPESREYLNNGGWKLHLTVKPENYGAVDAWLEKNHPGQYKLLHGGDAGEKDFTVYVGSKAGASALAAKIEKEIGDKIEKSNAGSEDTPFGAKVAGRFDTLKRNGFAYYGRGGLPYDQDAKDAEFQMMSATDPAEKAKWRQILDNHEQRIKKTLSDKYGERFTGEAPRVAKPKGTHFQEAQRQLGKMTPEQDKALRDFFDVAGRFLPAFDGVFSGVEWSNEDDPSAGFVYDSTRNVLRLHLPKLAHYMGKVDGKPRVNDPRKWALAAIAEEATHAVTVQLIAEGAIDPDALLAALRGASKASAQAFIDSYLGANGAITVKAKDGTEKEVSLQALEFIRMVVQGRITLDVDGVRVDGELTELQYNKSLLKKIFEAITKVLEVLKVLSSSKSPVAAAIRDEADKIARRLDALMSARPDVAKDATSDTEQSQVASTPPGDSAKVLTSPAADQQTETGASPEGVVAPEPVAEKPADEPANLDGAAKFYSDLHQKQIDQETAKKAEKGYPVEEDHIARVRAEWSPEAVRNRVAQFLQEIDSRDPDALLRYHNGLFDAFWKLLTWRTGQKVPATEKGRRDFLSGFVGQAKWDAAVQKRADLRAADAEKKKAEKDARTREHVRNQSLQWKAVINGETTNGAEWLEREILTNGARVEKAQVNASPIKQWAVVQADGNLIRGTNLPGYVLEYGKILTAEAEAKGQSVPAAKKPIQAPLDEKSLAALNAALGQLRRYNPEAGAGYERAIADYAAGTWSLESTPPPDVTLADIKADTERAAQKWSVAEMRYLGEYKEKVIQRLAEMTTPEVYASMKDRGETFIKDVFRKSLLSANAYVLRQFLGTPELTQAGKASDYISNHAGDIEYLNRALERVMSVQAKAPKPTPAPAPATEITVQQHTLLNRDIKPMDKTIKISEIPKELKRQSQMLAVLNALIPCLKA